jgi:hypothetical protein
MATRIGLKANAISQALFRARRSLIECVKGEQVKEVSL